MPSGVPTTKATVLCGTCIQMSLVERRRILTNWEKVNAENTILKANAIIASIRGQRAGLVAKPPLNAICITYSLPTDL